jgi:[protein-PII] uridylyltransferase
VEEILSQALRKADFDFSPFLAHARARSAYHLPPEMEFPTKLVISNEVHPTYTVIDLQTPDRLGLLYDVLYCFSGWRVNIAHSRVATEKGAAFDSFYVTDFEGRKLTNETTLGQLRSALLRAATNTR